MERLTDYLEKLGILNVLMIPRLVSLQKMQSKLQVVVRVTGWGFLTCLNNFMFSFLSFPDYKAVVGCSCGLVLHISYKQACRDCVLHMWLVFPVVGGWMDGWRSGCNGGAWKVALCPLQPKEPCVIRACWLSSGAQRSGFARGFALVLVYITALFCWV